MTDPLPEPVGDDNDEDDDSSYKDSDQEYIDLETDPEPTSNLRRSNQVQIPNPRYQNLHMTNAATEMYSTSTADIIAKTIIHYNMAMTTMTKQQFLSFLQTFSLKQGLQEFGKKGEEAAYKEMIQLHDRVVCKPIHINELTKKTNGESHVSSQETRR